MTELKRENGAALRTLEASMDRKALKAEGDACSPSGFTLIELVIVVLLIGILAYFGVPSYIKTIENGRAEAAFGVLNSVAAANSMYVMDKNVYARGQLSTGSPLPPRSPQTCPTCPSLPVPPPGPASNCSAAMPCGSNGLLDACNLVFCGYLASRGWAGDRWDYVACDPSDGSGGGCCDVGYVACATRKGDASFPYNMWGYGITRDSRVLPMGGAPAPAAQ